MATPSSKQLFASGNNPDSSVDPLESADGTEPQMTRLPLALIDPDPHQPRRVLGEITDLALSIRQHGLLNSIIVEAVAGGRYRILAGERRFAACKSLKLDTLPCIVRTVEEQSRLALQLIENMHRKDLSPIEEAQGLRRLMEEFNLTQRELARQVGKSVASVNQTLRVLDLDPALLATVQTSEILSKSVLLEVAKEPDSQRQRELWEQAKTGELTVREARASKTKRNAPGGPKRGVVNVAVPEATVRVRVVGGDLTKERITEILRAAITKIAEGSHEWNVNSIGS